MSSSLETTIEKMQSLVNRLDQTIVSAQDLTEEQQQDIMTSPEFEQLLKTHNELCKAVDQELGEQK
jgi:hypothetical protein